MLRILASKLKVIALLNFLERHFKKKDSKDSLNTESPHIQFFPLKRFKALLNECRLSVIKMENRRFLSGPFSGRILSKSEILINWNVKVASKLPYFLVSSWMFVAKHREADEE